MAFVKRGHETFDETDVLTNPGCNEIQMMLDKATLGWRWRALVNSVLQSLETADHPPCQDFNVEKRAGGYAQYREKVGKVSFS